VTALVDVPRRGAVHGAVELGGSGGRQASVAIKTEARQTVMKIDQGSQGRDEVKRQEDSLQERGVLAIVPTSLLINVCSFRSVLFKRCLEEPLGGLRKRPRG